MRFVALLIVFVYLLLPPACFASPCDLHPAGASETAAVMAEAPDSAAEPLDSDNCESTCCCAPCELSPCPFTPTPTVARFERQRLVVSLPLFPPDIYVPPRYRG